MIWCCNRQHRIEFRRELKCNSRRALSSSDHKITIVPGQTPLHCAAFTNRGISCEDSAADVVSGPGTSVASESFDGLCRPKVRHKLRQRERLRTFRSRACRTIYSDTDSQRA